MMKRTAVNGTKWLTELCKLTLHELPDLLSLTSCRQSAYAKTDSSHFERSKEIARNRTDAVTVASILKSSHVRFCQERIAALVKTLTEDCRDYRYFCLRACLAGMSSNSWSAMSAQILANLQEFVVVCSHVNEATQ